MRPAPLGEPVTAGSEDCTTFVRAGQTPGFGRHRRQAAQIEARHQLDRQATDQRGALPRQQAQAQFGPLQQPLEHRGAAPLQQHRRRRARLQPVRQHRLVGRKSLSNQIVGSWRGGAGGHRRNRRNRRNRKGWDRTETAWRSRARRALSHGERHKLKGRCRGSPVNALSLFNAASSRNAHRGCAPVVSSLPPPFNLRKPWLQCNEAVRIQQARKNPSPKNGHVPRRPLPAAASGAASVRFSGGPG
ncbi:hypothetical protein OJJOAM_001887 [Cupriavidus sp. H18C1]